VRTRHLQLAASAALSLLAPPLEAASRYDDLVALFQDWRAFQAPRRAAGVPDYTAPAMARQRDELRGFQDRLKAIDTSGWTVAQRVDWELVRAEMNGLEFDHRVLRPWTRDPAFYRVVWPEQSDTPAHEGPAFAGAVELWQFPPPLTPVRLAELRQELGAIPGILDQARANLVEDVRDHWLAGIYLKRTESEALGDYERRVAAHHPDLAPDLARALRAVDGFRQWLEAGLPRKTGRAGVRPADYDWYMRHVQLVPFTWRDEVALMERELGRSRGHLALLRHRNRDLPELAPAATAAEHAERSNAAVSEVIRFLRERDVMEVPDYFEPALRAQVGSFTPPDQPRDFFTQVDLREPLLLRCHGIHWFELARMERQPHPSPIRRGPLLYNVWGGRAEGLSTAMEETMMSAGLLEGRPRGQELFLIGVANRAARGLAGLKVHGGELTLEQALDFAARNTPNGWLIRDGDTNWGEQKLYLQQPGYGTTYLTGKAQIEALIGEVAAAEGARFTLRRFFDRFFAPGLIPVSLIRWEMTGDESEIRALR
jgi:hypothetical protein